jgi:hypothetical protein
VVDLNESKAALPDFLPTSIAIRLSIGFLGATVFARQWWYGPHRRLVASHQHFYGLLRTWDYGRLLLFPNLKANQR